MANRYLAGDEVRPRLVWENVKGQIIRTPYGFLVFDDTVADKNFSHNIELVRRQYSGNAHGVIKGIGVVTCVYINPQMTNFELSIIAFTTQAAMARQNWITCKTCL